MTELQTLVVSGLETETRVERRRRLLLRAACVWNKEDEMAQVELG